jgi:hypothetical protein
MENLNGGNADSYGGSMNGSIFSQQEDLSSSPDEPSTVDHALLESLFYNEMMQLDGSSLLSPNFLSQHLSEAAASTPSRRRINHSISADVNTLAEKDLLRDFGVTSSPVHHGSADVVPPPLIEAGSSNHGSTPWGSEPYSPASNSMNIDTPSQNHLYHSSMHYSHAPSAQAPMHSTYEPVVASHQQYMPPSSAMPPASMQVAPAVRATYTPPSQVSSAGLGEGTRHVPSLPALQAPLLQERTNNQLVSQFTTLASRLGVDLPLSILQSLTAAAAANVSKVQARTAPSITKGINTVQQSNSMLTMDSNSFSEDEMDMDNGEPGPAAAPDTVTPVVQELRKTAEEAIAAVSENRKRALEDPSATSPNDGNASGRAIYSKRRKKPRLSDCETKLAELQAENELLKRHLANVSNKAYRFEQEKTQAGARFKKMLDGEYVPEQLEKAVQEFTDLYSDYGRRRQQELSFHLEQLQRQVMQFSEGCSWFPYLLVCD